MFRWSEMRPLRFVLDMSVVDYLDSAGIQLIYQLRELDDEGRIAEFEVMVRPMSGLQALGEEMGRRVGATLPAFKAQGS